MKWLKEHMQSYLTTKPVANDLELLDLAAQAMRRNDDQKAESEARAQTMVTHAQGELKIVERLLQTSESARIAAEMEMQKSKARLDEVESLLEARMELVEQERTAGEQRARAAEQRAKEAEDGLQHLQTALRSLFKRGLETPEQALDKDTVQPSDATAARRRASAARRRRAAASRSARTTPLRREKRRASRRIRSAR
jgi:hypothetical protein